MYGEQWSKWISLVCYFFRPTWLVCTSCWFRIVQLSPLIPRFPIAMAVVPLAKDTSWTPMGLSLKYWPAKRLFVVKLMLFLTAFRSEFLKNSAAICRDKKTTDMMLNADVSDGVFYSKGDGSENFQDRLKNSDQNSLRILTLTEFFKNYDSDRIL